MTPNTHFDYDIIVAGGGMIGSSLALALEPLGLQVAVVEAVAQGASVQPSFDDRSTALSRSTQRMFEALGIWPGIVATATPIAHIHVSDRGRFGFSHIDAAEQNVEALGYVVINRVLGEVLHERLRQTQGLDWISPARIVSVRRRDGGNLVTVEQGGLLRELSCRLLVAADGARSSVRDMIGISASIVDYEQVAVIGNLKPGKDIRNTAYERFAESGPLAMLPIADQRAAFIWTLRPDKANELLHASDENFLSQLQEAFGGRLGRFSRIGKRAAYPLSLSKANGLVAHHAVLIGNAAHGLHPVAAQGFNLGMRDVATLCDCLLDEQRRQAEAGKAFDPGNPAMLDTYATWRRSDQGKLVTFTDGLVRLFASSRKPAVVLRNVAMLGFDFVPGVRRLFARHTMGLAGKLPRLSRGLPLA